MKSKSVSEALWAEHRDKGVKVLAVCPGSTKTGFSDTAGFAQLASGTSEQYRYTTPEAVVQEALRPLEGETSTVVTGGLANQIIVNIPRLFPRDTLVKLVEPPFRPQR